MASSKSGFCWPIQATLSDKTVKMFVVIKRAEWLDNLREPARSW